MGNEAPQSRTTLQDWEAWLAPQVQAVELLGEVPISADECQQLGKVIDTRLWAGFKHAWAERDYRTIVKVAQRLPEAVLQEDPGLLMYYDNALMQAEQEPVQKSFALRVPNLGG